MWFETATVYVSAKTESEAKKKAYAKIKKKGGPKIIKKETQVDSSIF